MQRYAKRKEIRLCEWCKQAFEYHNGKQFSMHIWVNPDDEKESCCSFCGAHGFDSLYIL